MNYTGVIIEESLENTSLLKDITVLSTKIETVTESHRTPWLKQWTLHTIEINEDKAKFISSQLSNVLEKEHQWYGDFKNDQFHYIIFRGKVFKVNRNNPQSYEKVKEYGVSLGIPEHQLDFSPNIK